MAQDSNNSGKVTMQSIADAAGVHRTTVSLALRHHHSIPEATRQRIEGIARQLGYRPNPLVSALMTDIRSRHKPKATLPLAFVSFYPVENEGIRHLATSDSWLGAQARADELGFKIETFVLGHDGLTEQRLDQVLRARGITGLILGPTVESKATLHLSWERYAAVCIGHTVHEPNLNRVSNHQFNSMRTALWRLKELGYQRLGLAIDPDTDERVDRTFSASFFAEQYEVPEANRIPIFHPRGFLDRLPEWYQTYHPDVIVGANFEICQVLESMGVGIPDDVGFVHIHLPKHPTRYSGIRQEFDTVGAATVDMVVAHLNRNERGIPRRPKTMMLEGQWVEGETVTRQSRKKKQRTSSSRVHPDKTLTKR